MSADDQPHVPITSLDEARAHRADLRDPDWLPSEAFVIEVLRRAVAEEMRETLASSDWAEPLSGDQL